MQVWKIIQASSENIVWMIGLLTSFSLLYNQKRKQTSCDHTFFMTGIGPVLMLASILVGAEPGIRDKGALVSTSTLGFLA